MRRKKIKIRHNHWLPKLIRTEGITLYPFILLREKKEYIKRDTYKHELQHCYQIEELGILNFYASYIFYFLAGLFRYRNGNEAYHKIPYEEEAYKVQGDPWRNRDIKHLNLKNEGISYE